MKKPTHSILKRTGALMLAVLMTLTLFLAGCGAQSEQPQEEKSSSEGAVQLNYGISNSWDSLMPYYSVSGSNYSRIIYDKIYDRLAYVEPDGTCLPRGAESWESADNNKAIVFHLNQKAAFHDGTAVTAQHWADTIALVTDPACETLGRSAFARLTGTDDTGAAVAGETLGAEAVDDYTLKLSFKSPVIPEEFLVDLNRDIYVLPTHLLKDIPKAELMTADFWLKPVGSGPCKFASEVSGSSLVLEANKDYQLGAPGFDTMTITVMDKANLLTALIAGDLDYYAFGGNVSDENRPVAEEAGFEVQEGTIPGTFYELMLNNTTISDVNLRQAINLALDKELMCEQRTGGRGVAVSSSIMPDTDFAQPQTEGSYDPEGAKALLKQSNYDGKTYTLACTKARASLAALVEQNLEEIGIPVEIETVDSATMFAGMFDGVYDMAVASHTPTNLPLWFTGSRFNEDNNLFCVKDLSQYQKLIQAVQDETDAEARKPLVKELEDYLAQEMPFVPLWFSNSLHVQSKTVTGIDYPASSYCNENVWEWQKS